MKMNKSFKIFIALLLSTVLMTTLAYATGVGGVVDKAKDEVATAGAAIVVIFTIIGLVKLASKQAFVQAVITAIFGFGLAYAITVPDTIAGIINATMKGIIG